MGRLAVLDMGNTIRSKLMPIPAGTIDGRGECLSAKDGWWSYSREHVRELPAFQRVFHESFDQTPDAGSHLVPGDLRDTLPSYDGVPIAACFSPL